MLMGQQWCRMWAAMTYQESLVEQMLEPEMLTINGKKMDCPVSLAMSLPIKQYYKHTAGFLQLQVLRYCIMVMNMANMAGQTQIIGICTGT